MNGKDMLEMMSELDEKVVADAAVTPIRKSRGKWKIVLGAVAAALVVGILGYTIYPYVTGKNSGRNTEELRSGTLMASPKYPEIPENPELSHGYDAEESEEYFQTVMALRKQPEGYQDGYDAYLKDVLGVIFSDTGNGNKAFSPLCLYMALGMTAEITDGTTQQQILDVLHQPDIATLRNRAKSIWLANYMDDGLSKLVLANSLWMNNERNYEKSVLDTLANNYFASSYSGDPSSEKYSQTLRDWINEQTDGLLENMLSDLKLDPDLMIALVSTVNYCGKWADPFLKSETKDGTFHAPSGDINCKYMCTDAARENYYGDHFECVSLPIINNGSVRFILPEEGMTPEELLMDEELLQFLNTESYKWDKTIEAASVHMEVPKFDISSDIKLNDYLKALGIEDLFEAGDADFSPLVGKSDENFYVNSIEQNTRIMIDEEGCKAVSATIIMAGAGQTKEHFEFILDRPFVFEIVSDTGLPLFVGVVNDPTMS